MNVDRLLPCPSCDRHVRASEAACPFCAAALPVALRSSQPLPRSPATRLSRAALFALGTSAAALAAACGGTTAPSTFAGADAADEGGQQPQPVYGGPPVDGGADVVVNPSYGGPAQQDAAADADADADADGGREGGSAPVYGGPP
jgi:hypothetical protein